MPRQPRESSPPKSSEKSTSVQLPLEDVLDALRALAPEELAEPWDKAGLHLGSQSQRITAGLLCIDLTEAVVAEAVKKKCELIVAYHPPIFAPLERLTDEGPWTQRRILAAARAGLAVYSPHTALDAAEGGVCDWLASVLAGGISSIASSQPITANVPNRDEYKIVVFVPEADEAKVRRAMSEAGAGGIGLYRECAFAVSGTGGFTPMRGSNPSVGRVGRREEVAERRLEMLVPGVSLAAAMSAMREAHPYEEPAADVLKLAAEPASTGPGRVMRLKQPTPVKLLATRLRKITHMPVEVGGPVNRAVTTIALCPGSGGKLFEGCDADAYVTGEMSHHQALDLAQRGKPVILAGHTQTERPYLPVYRDRIRESAAGGLRWEVSAADVAPLAWV